MRRLFNLSSVKQLLFLGAQLAIVICAVQFSRTEVHRNDIKIMARSWITQGKTILGYMLPELDVSPPLENVIISNHAEQIGRPVSFQNRLFGRQIHIQFCSNKVLLRLRPDIERIPAPHIGERLWDRWYGPSVAVWSNPSRCAVKPLAVLWRRSPAIFNDSGVFSASFGTIDRGFKWTARNITDGNERSLDGDERFITYSGLFLGGEKNEKGQNGIGTYEQQRQQTNYVVPFAEICACFLAVGNLLFLGLPERSVQGFLMALGGLIIFMLCFRLLLHFSETVGSAESDVSATRYGRTENIRVLPIVVPKFKFRNVERHVFCANLVESP
jgi:hypothetical protein